MSLNDEFDRAVRRRRVPEMAPRDKTAAKPSPRLSRPGENYGPKDPTRAEGSRGFEASSESADEKAESARDMATERSDEASYRKRVAALRAYSKTKRP